MRFSNPMILPEAKRSHGYTRLGMAFAVLLVVFGMLLAVTKFLDLSDLMEGSMDEGVVKAVQEGISAYARNPKRSSRSAPPYPDVLDEADVGDSTPDNLFFFYVLPKGVAVEGWSKTGKKEYRSPSGGTYVYDSLSGSFALQAASRDAPKYDVARIQRP